MGGTNGKVLGGCIAREKPEFFNEVALIAEAGGIGQLGEWQAGRLREQMQGALHTYDAEECLRRSADIGSKKAAELFFTQTDGLSPLLHIQLRTKMGCLQSGLHALDVIRGLKGEAHTQEVFDQPDRFRQPRRFFYAETQPGEFSVFHVLHVDQAIIKPVGRNTEKKSGGERPEYNGNHFDGAVRYHIGKAERLAGQENPGLPNRLRSGPGLFCERPRPAQGLAPVEYQLKGAGGQRAFGYGPAAIVFQNPVVFDIGP